MIVLAENTLKKEDTLTPSLLAVIASLEYVLGESFHFKIPPLKSHHLPHPRYPGSLVRKQGLSIHRGGLLGKSPIPFDSFSNWLRSLRELNDFFCQDNGIRKEGHRLDAVPHEINALYRVLSFYPDPAPYPHLYQEVCRCHTLQSDTLSSSPSHRGTQDIASAFLKTIPGIPHSVH